MAGELQCLVNEATAAQDAAIVRLAAVEPQWCEDGTLIEVHRPLGHGALDAPSVVSGVLGLTAVAAERRVRQALRTAADGPEGTESCTGLGGLHAAMASGVLDAYRAQVVAAELEECPPEVAATVVASLEGWFGVEDSARLRRRARRTAGADQPGPAPPARTACPVGVEPAAVGRRARRRHLARDVPLRGGLPGVGGDRRARPAVRHRRHLRTHRPGPRQGPHRPRHPAGDRRRPGRPHHPRLDQPRDQPRSRRGRRAGQHRAGPGRPGLARAGRTSPGRGVRPGHRRPRRRGRVAGDRRVPARQETRRSGPGPGRAVPVPRLPRRRPVLRPRPRHPLAGRTHHRHQPGLPLPAPPPRQATPRLDCPAPPRRDPHLDRPHSAAAAPPTPSTTSTTPPSPAAANIPTRASPRASPASPSPTHPTAPSNTATNTTSAPPDPAPPAAPTPTTSPRDASPPPSPPRTGDPATAWRAPTGDPPF